MLSFRDPSGRVMVLEDAAYRFLDKESTNQLREFLALEFAQELVREGLLVSTEETKPPEGEKEFVLRHERVPFISYPYEWSPHMLAAAGELTLHLAKRAFAVGWGLKDATPYNVLFRGPFPLFVDVASFERRDPLDPIWLPFGQFVRTFLIPLLLNRHFSLSLAAMFLSNRDGVLAQEAIHFFPRTRRYLPPVLELVTIPAALGRRVQSGKRKQYYERRRTNDPRKAQFILQSLLDRALKQLHRLTPPPETTSFWTNYTEAHHSPDYHRAKLEIVENFLRTYTPRRVLDLGCNTGDYSVLAARQGATVVGVDSDEAVIGRLWLRAHREKLDILPLVVNIARPSPSVGWLNQECPSFLERAETTFDAVFMLALIHHLLVRDRIPFPEMVRLAARLTTRYCIIEYIPADDPKFQDLTGGWNELYADWTHDQFRQQCARYFDTIAEWPLKGSKRWLHLLVKKTDISSGL